jgi:hypothetical protein
MTIKSFCLKILYATTVILTLLITTVMGVCDSPQSHTTPAVQVLSKAWSFGVMGDTQWTLATDPGGNNPNGVSVSIIDQINKQFIDKGVKFVIEVGDLTENGSNAAIASRAIASQTLYNAGIGFFPMRGNHETYAKPFNGYAIAAFQTNFPQTQCLSNTFGAANCSSPSLVSNDLIGMSYSFDYGPAGSNARFVIIDDWATSSKRFDATGYPYGYSIFDQQFWINSRLDKNNRGTDHVFVFSHQPLIAENHQDSLFSGYTNANPEWQNTFLACLQNNDVKYYITGHDHIHQRSIITSPDGIAKIQELICASNSSKFYTPKPLADSKWYGQKSRETSVSQELQTVGYYIFTVDGPRVTVHYYSDDHGSWLSDEEYPAETGKGLINKVTPTFNFVKKATWGYSLNGKEFLVGGTNGTSYTVVQDRFRMTSAKILSGTYSNKATDYNGRIITQTVNMGWSPKTQGINSDILTLWGMADLGIGQTDVFTLSLSYDHESLNHDELKRGLFGMVTKDVQGNWVNAVDKNFGGKKKFVYGPWLSEYELGTYGVDPHTKTVWAVINYNGDFAAVRFNGKH